MPTVFDDAKAGGIHAVQNLAAFGQAIGIPDGIQEPRADMPHQPIHAVKADKGRDRVEGAGKEVGADPEDRTSRSDRRRLFGEHGCPNIGDIIFGRVRHLNAPSI